LIAGILLAAGGSTRYGQPKLLLPWKGNPLIHHIAEIAALSGLEGLFVVVGAETDKIYRALEDIPCCFIENPQWKDGLSSSVKSGIKALDDKYSACMFLLGDQPFVSVELIDQLIDLYQRQGRPITAPRAEGKRTNPVIFDRAVFPDLLLVEGDKGGRELFSKYPTAWLEWSNTNLLKDIDTPQDYLDSLKQGSRE
jgi:molybdenum cofactor cytidylyltransferase